MNADIGTGDRPASEPLRPTRVAIFEARPVVAEGLAALLSGADGVDIVGATSHTDEAIRMIQEADVQVVVFGVEGQATEQLRRAVTEFTDAAAAVDRAVGLVAVVPGGPEAAERFGGAGLPTVVTTAVSPSGLRDAILSAAPGEGPAVSLRLARRRVTTRVPVRPDAGAHLTRREREVLRWIERGQSTQEIAAELGITPNTVRTHVQHLMPKLGVHSRLQAAALGAAETPPDPGVDPDEAAPR